MRCLVIVVSAWCAAAMPGIASASCSPGTPGVLPPSGCVCQTTWTYGGETFCDSQCANPDGDPDGPWCFTAQQCFGQTFAHCSGPTPDASGGDPFPGWAPPPGCTCRSAWTYGGQTFSGVCGNPDGDANGPWCFTDALCNGRNYAYCTLPADPPFVCASGPAPGAAPPEGCECKPQWTYRGRVSCGCDNPDADPNGPWCVTSGPCQGRSWTYCPPSSGTPPIADPMVKRVIEVAVVFDAAFAARHPTGPHNAVSNLVNGVKEIFRVHGAGTAIDLSLVWVAGFVTDAATPPSLRPSSSLDAYLDAFTSWARDTRNLQALAPDLAPALAPDFDPAFDAIILVTGRDLPRRLPCSSAGCAAHALGVAWLGTMCTKNSAAVVRDTGPATTAQTLAHELAHLLGAPHDGDGNACVSGFLMDPFQTQHSQPDMSSCTLNSIVNALQQLEATQADGGCLKNSPRVPPGLVCGDGIRAGSEQCDDGNTLPKDGCSPICTLMPGWECSGTDNSVCRQVESIPDPPGCPYDGAYCDDGNACTTNDYCLGGVCTGHSPVACPSSDCFHTGACDPETGRCEYTPRSFSMDELQQNRDMQCAATWATYAGTWVAGGRQGATGSCDLGCGALSCTNTEWTNYCWSESCPAGKTCPIAGDTVTGPATIERCSCIPPLDNGAGTVRECTPCVDASGVGGFCSGGVCLTAPDAPPPTPGNPPTPTASPLPDAAAAGGTLVLQRSDAGREKLTFKAVDAELPFPPRGSGADPTITGAALELFSGTGEAAYFDLPATGWRTNRKGTSYKFVNRKAAKLATALNRAVVRSTDKGTVIELTASRTGLTLDGAQGAVGLRLTIGSQRICTRFADGAVSIDAAGRFTGSNSLEVGDCDANTLRGYP